MNDNPADDLPRELLAAYADEELGPCDRARVERWLADRPEARELLDDQETFAPRNSEFWRAVRPPEPSRRQWAAALRGVRDGALGPASRRWTGWAGSLALAATAMAATILILLPAVPPPVTTVAPAAPPAAAAVEPFAMAGPEDVRIISLPESAAHLLVVGEHPLRDKLVVLARADQVELLGIGTDLAGRFPWVPADVAPDDAPMIWAPRDP